jgi:hypothetical protein
MIAPTQVVDPTPVWRWDAFAGEFCDAFIKSTGLEGAAGSAASIDELVRVTRDVIASKTGDAPALLTQEDVATVEAICADLSRAAKIDRRRMEVRDASSMQQFLVFFIGELSALAPGERLAWGGGWCDKGGGHALMFSAERSSAAADSNDSGGSFSLVVCNSGEGVNYHPSKEEYPKTKSRTAIRIGNIPRDAFLDQAVWYTFFKITCFPEDEHGPEMMYEVILPHLCSMVPLSSAGMKTQQQHAWLEAAAKGAHTLFVETKDALLQDKERLLSGLEQGEIQSLLEATGKLLRYRCVEMAGIACRTHAVFSSRVEEGSVEFGQVITVSEVVPSVSTAEGNVEYLKLADGSGYFPLGRPKADGSVSPDEDQKKAKWFQKIPSDEDAAKVLGILQNIPQMLDCSAGAGGLSVEDVGGKLEGRVVGLYIAAGTAVLKSGHTGEYRDIASRRTASAPITRYCSLAAAPEGVVCAHDGGVVTGSHWSCCGARNLGDTCLKRPPSSDDDDDEPVSAADSTWACEACTSMNAEALLACEVCQTPRAESSVYVAQSNFCKSLSRTYAKLREAGGSKFEIVFLSSDADEETFNAHALATGPRAKKRAKPMPWLTLPYIDREHVTQLIEALGLDAKQEHFLLFGPDGKLISAEAKALVEETKETLFPWDIAASTKQVMSLIEQLRATKLRCPSLAEHVRRSGDRNGDFETTQRSGTCYYRCILSLFKFLLKTDGMNDKLGRQKRKQLFYAIRVGFLRVTQDHLATEPFIATFEESDLKVVEIACCMTALAAVKEHKRGSIDLAGLKCAQELCEGTLQSAKSALQLQLGPASGSLDRCLQITSGCAQLGGFGNFEMLAALGQEPFSSRFTGETEIVSGSTFINMLQLSEPVPKGNFAAANERLVQCLEACKLLRQKSAQERVKCLQIVSLIQHVLTATLPLPLPRQHDGGCNPDCIWSGAKVTRAQQKELLDSIDDLLSMYAMATFSSAHDRGSDSARIVTTGAIYSIFCCVAGVQATDGAFVESTVLAGTVYSPKQDAAFEAQAPFALSSTGFDGTSYADICDRVLLYSPHLLMARKSTVEYFASVASTRPAFEFSYKDGHDRRSPLRLDMEHTSMKFVQAVTQRLGINDAPGHLTKRLEWLTATTAQKMGAWLAAPADDWLAVKADDDNARLCALLRDVTWKAKLCCLPSTAQLFEENHALPKMWTKLTCEPEYAYLGPGDHESVTACISATTRGQRKVAVIQEGMQSKAHAGRFASASASGAAPTPAVAQDAESPEAIMAQMMFGPMADDIISQFPEELISQIRDGDSEETYNELLEELEGGGMQAEMVEALLQMIFVKITGKGVAPPRKVAQDGTLPTEEDVLFAEELPTFGDSCREEESERIVSYLTVPSLAAPLLLAFFANERVGLLRNVELQMILEAVLFEPRDFASEEPALQVVPEPASMLATPLGTLVHDAARVPDALLYPLVQLCTSAADLCIGNYKSTFSELLLFLVRTAARIETVFEFVQTEERVKDWKPSADTAEHLRQLRSFLRETAAPMITIWMSQAQADKDTPAATTCSMHLAMVHSSSMTTHLHNDDLIGFMSSVGFVVSWLCAPGSKQVAGRSGSKQSRQDSMSVQPVHDVFGLITTRRQQVMQWLSSADDADRDGVLSAVVGAALQGETPPDLDSAHTSSDRKMSQSVTRGWRQTEEKPLECSFVVETEHPHQAHTDSYWTITFPGAAYLSLCFDERSKTEHFSPGETPSDYVTVYKDHTKTQNKIQRHNGAEKIAGTNSETWPGVSGPPMTVPGDTCVVHFHSDGSGEEWGFKLTVTAPIDSTAVPRLLQLPALATNFSGESELVKTQAARLALVATRNHGGAGRPALPHAGTGGGVSADEYLTSNTAALVAQAQKDVAEVKVEDTGSSGEYADPSGIVTCNMQTGEVFLRHRVQMPTPMPIATHPDFADMFESSPVCTIDSQLENRQVLSIFEHGRKYSVDAWRPLLKPSSSALSWGGYPEVALRCKPEAIEDAAGAVTWLGSTYQPYQVEGWPIQSGANPTALEGAAVVRTVLNTQMKDMKMDVYPKIWLCKEHCSLLLYVAPIGSKQEREGHMGQFFEMQVPRPDLVHVFALVESSRILHRCQVYSSDCRHALKRLQPDDEKRQDPPARNTRHAAGPMFGGMMTPSALTEFTSLTVKRNRVVTNAELLQASIAAREERLWSESPQAAGDVEGSIGEWTTEIMVPRHLLDGLLPDALLETYRFFKTGDRTLRGYPRSDIDGNEELALRVKLAEDGTSALVYRDFCPLHFAVEPSDTGSKDAPLSMVLLNPISAAPDSDLSRIASLFSRVENLSHVLCWSRSAKAELGDEVEISVIELPRLQLRFRCRNHRLYSLDHDGLFLAEAMDASVAKLTEHIPHALVLESNSGQRQVLVPSYELKRVSIGSCPLNSELVLTSSSPEEPERWHESDWCKNTASRFWMYPVHVSGSYLTTPSLSAALYLVLIMLMRRQYAEASRLLANCFTDTPLTKQEMWIVEMIASTAAAEESMGSPDQHPDCVACRLKLAIVCYECGHKPSWDVPADYARLVQTYAHVSKACGLSVEEEDQLLGHCKGMQTRALYLKQVKEAAKTGQPLDASYESSPETIGGAKLAHFMLGLTVTILDGFEGGVGVKYNQQCPPLKQGAQKPQEKRTIMGDTAIALLRENEASDDLNGAGKGLGFGLLWEIATGELELDIGCGTQSKALAKMMLGAMICKHTSKFDENKTRGGQPDFVVPMALLCAPVLAALDDATPDGETSAWPKLPISKLREGCSFDQMGEFKTEALRQCKAYCSSPIFAQHGYSMNTRGNDGKASFLSAYPQPGTATSELKITPGTLEVMALPVPLDTAANERMLGGPADADAVSAFAHSPLDQLGLGEYVQPMDAIAAGDEPPLDRLPFEANDASVAGKSLLKRMRDDLESSAKALASATVFRLSCLNAEHLRLLENDLMGGAGETVKFGGSLGGPPMLSRQFSAGELTVSGQQVLKSALMQLRKLCAAAMELKVREEKAVRQESQFVVDQARNLTTDESDAVLVTNTQLFYLQRLAGHQFSIRFDWLASLLLSSTAVADLQRANPFLPVPTAERVLSAVSTVMFRVVRLGQLVSLVSNTVALMDSLKQLVSSRVEIEWGMRSSAVSTATLPTSRLISHALEVSGYEESAGKALMRQLLGAQDQLVGSVGGLLGKGVDARAALTVVFDFVDFDAQAAEALVKSSPELISTMLSLARRRCFYKGRPLHFPVPTTDAVPPGDVLKKPVIMRQSTVARIEDGGQELKLLASRVHKLRHQAQAVATVLTAKRRYCNELESGGHKYDPRFLMVEFVSGFMLRRRQVQVGT